MSKIKTFQEFIKENVWADLQDRSSGEVGRKEDDPLLTIDDEGLKGLLKYLTDHYEWPEKPYMNVWKYNYFGTPNVPYIHITLTDDGEYITFEPFSPKDESEGFITYGPEDIEYALDPNLVGEVFDPTAGEGPDDDEEQCYMVFKSDADKEPHPDGYTNSEFIEMLNNIKQNL